MVLRTIGAIRHVAPHVGLELEADPCAAVDGGLAAPAPRWIHRGDVVEFVIDGATFATVVRF